MTDIRDGRHFHSCVKCGFIWDHEPAIDGTKAEFDEAHTCAHCRSQRNCDIACTTREEAEQFAVYEFIKVGGKKRFAPPCETHFLMELLGKGFGS